MKVLANDLSMLLKTDKIELEAGLDIAKTLDNIMVARVFNHEQ